MSATKSLLFQSDESRKQAENRVSCHRRLNDFVLKLAKEVIPGETSQAQKERVRGLQTKSNEARLNWKKGQSAKKASRKGGRDD